MILVVGATGRLGSEICCRLAAKGKQVRALVRETSDPKNVDSLKEAGIELALGDARDRASLEAACQGAQAVVTTLSSMPVSYKPGENDIETVDLRGSKHLIDAAQATGAAHFVYISFTPDLDFPLRNAKRAVEQYLKDSGLTYTILRPSYFMQSWLSPSVGFDAADAKAQVYGTGENPISWISRSDVAQFAVESIDSPAARNAVIALGGPQALSQLEMIQIFAEISGRSFEVRHVPEDTLEEQQKGSSDGMQESFAGLMRCYARGDPVDMEETLKTFPIQLTSVREYAQSVLGCT